MPAMIVSSERAKIAEIEARLQWRRRSTGRLASIMVGSLLGMFTSEIPFAAGKSLFFPAFLPMLMGGFFCCSVVAIFTLSLSFPFQNRYLKLLLASEVVDDIPLMTEYHWYFAEATKYAHGRTRYARLVRAHILELLRKQPEAPTLDFNGRRLVCFIRMLPEVEDVEDCRLLLQVVAKIGTPDCFSTLDGAVRKACAGMLRKDVQAQHTLRALANECKVTIRARDNRVQVSHSLLRAADATHGLLRPVVPTRPKAETGELLRASMQTDGDGVL